LDYFPSYFQILTECFIRYELGYYAARERKLSEERVEKDEWDQGREKNW
jgi:hypothetical protein